MRASYFLLLVLIPLSLVPTRARAGTNEDLKMIYSHDLRFTKRPPSFRGGLTVHASFTKAGRRNDEREDLIYAVVRDRLVRNQIPSLPGGNDFYGRFRSGVEVSSGSSRVVTQMKAKTLLSPRLFAHFKAVEQPNSRLFRLEGYLLCMGYRLEASDPKGAYLLSPEIVWHEAVSIRDLSEGEIHEKLVLAIRRSVDDFVPRFKRWKEEETGPAGTGGTLTAIYKSRSLPNLEEEHEEFRPQPGPAPVVVAAAGNANAETVTAAPSKRRYLQIGASLGTPAIGNLNAGVWGLGSWALNVHASGMYINPEIRGGQLDVGYIFDREGSFQQSANINFSLFNETHTEEQIHQDSNNRGTKQVIHVHDTKPFIGVGYTSQWGPVRLSAGTALRIGRGNEQSFRFLIQAGFVPLISF